MRNSMQAEIDRLKALLEADRARYEAQINELNRTIAELKIRI